MSKPFEELAIFINQPYNAREHVNRVRHFVPLKTDYGKLLGSSE